MQEVLDDLVSSVEFPIRYLVVQAPATRVAKQDALHPVIAGFSELISFGGQGIQHRVLIYDCRQVKRGMATSAESAPQGLYEK